MYTEEELNNMTLDELKQAIHEELQQVSERIEAHTKLIPPDIPMKDILKAMETTLTPVDDIDISDAFADPFVFEANTLF